VQALFTEVVFDASSLINIEDAGRLDSLTPLGKSVLVPTKVEEELRKVPPGGFRPGKGSRRMGTWLKGRSFTLASLLQEESRDYMRFLTRFGAGESAAMSVALHRSAILVMDDGAARTRALQEQIECVTTEEFLRRLDSGEFGLL
jgi:predicted nucleic acid-binding protein